MKSILMLGGLFLILAGCKTGNSDSSNKDVVRDGTNVTVKSRTLSKKYPLGSFAQYGLTPSENCLQKVIIERNDGKTSVIEGHATACAPAKEALPAEKAIFTLKVESDTSFNWPSGEIHEKFTSTTNGQLVGKFTNAQPWASFPVPDNRPEFDTITMGLCSDSSYKCTLYIKGGKFCELVMDGDKLQNSACAAK